MKIKYITLIILTITFYSCKNYHNDFINWADNIEKGTDINLVKKNQPSYIEIDWSKPDTFNGCHSYYVKNIKGNRDILHMSYELVFKDNKYQYRDSNK